MHLADADPRPRNNVGQTLTGAERIQRAQKTLERQIIAFFGKMIQVRLFESEEINKDDPEQGKVLQFALLKNHMLGMSLHCARSALEEILMEGDRQHCLTYQLAVCFNIAMMLMPVRTHGYPAMIYLSALASIEKGHMYV